MGDLVCDFHSRLTKDRAKPKTSIFKSPNFRLSLSTSLILLLHRLLYRFFSRLRTNLLTKDATPFRRRNPRISRSLTSRFAPAIGASLGGFALGIYPADQLRITIAIYVATRAAEFTYNTLESDGWFKDKPNWLGSWMLMPFATGQLLHAFVFDRDCFPEVMIMRHIHALSGLSRLGIWRFHTFAYSQLRPAPTTHLSSKAALAVQR